jgi:hypothetical protein
MTLAKHIKIEVDEDVLGILRSVNDNLTPTDQNPTGKPEAFAHRNGDWIQTYLGGMAFPLDPVVEEIDIRNIAHALSMLCRFGGHCIRFYSVAEHSVHIARWLLQRGESIIVCKWGLLHDGSEGHGMVDLPRPVKVHLAGYKPAEEAIQAKIAERFGLPREMPRIVHEADQRMLTDEMQQNMAPSPVPWKTVLEPLGVRLRFWTPEEAEDEFLDLFDWLCVQERKAA